MTKRFLIRRTERVTYARIFDAEDLAEVYGVYLTEDGKGPADLDVDYISELLIDDYELISERVERNGDVIDGRIEVTEVTE